MKYSQIVKTVSIRYHADVVVCGGGTAGAFAALAAADAGKSVILIEQFGGLGGTATQGLVTPVMSSYIEGEPKCSYLANELNALLKERNALDDLTGRIFDPMMLKICLEQMCLRRKIKILFYSFITDVLMEENLLKAVVVANKSGMMAVGGSVFIDATGDGDVSVLCGAEYTKGDPQTGKNQPISLRYIIDNVDCAALSAFFASEIECTGIDNGTCLSAPDELYAAVSRAGSQTLHSLFEKAIAAGDLIPEDSWYWQMFKITGRPGSIGFNNPEFFEDVDGTDVEHLTRAQLEGKQAVFRQLRFYQKYMKGFENAYIAEIAPMVGVRESRNICTEYVVTAHDLLSRRKFPDAFCQSNYPIDVHGKTLYFAEQESSDAGESPFFEIPCRSLMVKNVQNLLVAGRCLGAEFLAQAAIRTQHTMRSSGEAAGILAALAAEQHAPVKELDGQLVRRIMKERGAEYA